MAALRIWSRFPAPHDDRSASDSPEWLARSARYAPLVGVLVALPAAFAYVFTGLWLPHAVSVLACMTAALLLTGAVHERAFVRFCDAFEPPADRSGRVAPRSLAPICLPMLVLAKFETLSSVDPSWIGVSLVCAAAFSRGCAVLVAGAGTSVTAPDGTVAAVPAPTGADIGVATAWSLAPLAGAMLWTGDASVFLSAAGLAFAASIIVRRLARRHSDPDAAMRFGAVQQAAELAFYLGVLATLSIADETIADPAS